MLSVCFKKLKVAEFDHSELSKLVNKTNEHPLENHQILYMQSKVMYLQWAYQYALKDMSNDGKCCKCSINFLCQLVLIRFNTFKQSKTSMITSKKMQECFLIQIIMLNWKRGYNPNCFYFQKPKMNSNNGPTKSWSISTVTVQLTSSSPCLSQNTYLKKKLIA